VSSIPIYGTFTYSFRKENYPVPSVARLRNEAALIQRSKLPRWVNLFVIDEGRQKEIRQPPSKQEDLVFGESQDNDIEARYSFIFATLH
jgi:hypothetical protein